MEQRTDRTGKSQMGPKPIALDLRSRPFSFKAMSVVSPLHSLTDRPRGGGPIWEVCTRELGTTRGPSRSPRSRLRFLSSYVVRVGERSNAVGFLRIGVRSFVAGGWATSQNLHLCSF